jgi:hypothetical protein
VLLLCVVLAEAVAALQQLVQIGAWAILQTRREGHGDESDSTTTATISTSALDCDDLAKPLLEVPDGS